MPRYPAGMLNKNTPGYALLQFVVNCSGQVDSASVVVLGATDSLFAAPAVASTLGTRFAPATVDGQRVAMRIEQRISFKTAIGSLGGRALPWWTPQCPPGGCVRP
ncbi:MAG: energy transducer TonB [Gemmatimonadota bacterium]